MFQIKLSANEPKSHFDEGEGANLDLSTQFRIHNAFAPSVVLSRLMADYGTLFMLILAALTFVIIGMFFIVYLMMIGEREKKKLKAKEVSSTAKEKIEQECPHYLGYLSQYPVSQPVPEECFGCVEAIECMNSKPTEMAAEVEESLQQ